MDKPIILYAEDEKTLSDLYLERFSFEDWQVFLAKTGQEAVELAKEKKPKVIILDIMMPEKDGLEVLRELKALPEFVETNIIILSVLPNQEIIDKSLEAGATDYLIKSQITPTDVIDKIKKFL